MCVCVCVCTYIQVAYFGSQINFYYEDLETMMLRSRTLKEQLKSGQTWNLQPTGRPGLGAEVCSHVHTQQREREREREHARTGTGTGTGTCACAKRACALDQPRRASGA